MPEIRDAASNRFPDELKFVDADIRAEFEGKNYIAGTALQTQLIKSINRLCVLLENKDTNEPQIVRVK